MNRDQRRNLNVAELKKIQDELELTTGEHAEQLARQGFVIPPFARFEILITTLADMAFGENTRQRIEFEIAVQERWMQLFDPDNIARMKQDALDIVARQRLLQGVAGATPPPSPMMDGTAGPVIQLPHQ